ncbi:ABC transporter family substrate-binding protein [Gulosibacter sediminis]|uniref:ABC transporter family substrate-binding protein n=1 Tax=Gulosibacter sediminis TaxID=1729695 RepID=UPI0024A9B916|nr:ABC transporter family substrate-binding protein [Gulosibacter sediminis]
MKKRMIGGLAALAAFSLVLSGCARADEDPNSTSDGGTEPLDITANEINPKDYDELGEGGTLRLGNNAYPANFNTASNDGNEVNTVAIMNAVYPNLYTYTADGQIVANDLYTESLELTNESPMTIEVQLKEGITWSDGTPLDWTSVKNSADAMVNPDFDVASREGWELIDSVEQGDNEYTAVITLKEGEIYADWQGLVSAMPDALVESADMFNSGWVEKPLVTAGPYKIDKADGANKVVTLVPDENWNGDRKARLDRISFTTYEDPQASATAFQDGQLDMVDAGTQAVYTVVSPQVESGDYDLRSAAGPDWTHFTLNGSEGNILADQNLRQAFNYAIDRKSIFQALNGTMPYPDGMADDLLGNHMLVQNQSGYENNAGDYGTADVEKAKELIEASGWEMGDDGYYAKDGETLTVRYVYNAGSQTNGTVAPIATENLKEAGIELKIEQVPPTDLFSKYVIPGDYDVTLFGWAGNPFVTSSVSIWKSDGEQNFSGVGNDELDSTLDELNATTDPDQQITLLNEADQQLWEVAGNLPLFQAYDFFVTDPDLANLGAPGFASIPDWTMVGFVEGADNLS